MSDLQEQQGGKGAKKTNRININEYANKLYGTDIQKVSDVVSIINNKMNNITADKSRSIIFTFQKIENKTIYEVLEHSIMATWGEQQYTFLTNDNIETQLLEHLVPSDKLVVTFAFDSIIKKWGITKIDDGFSSSELNTTIEDGNPTPQTNINSEGVRSAIIRIRSGNMVAAKMEADAEKKKQQEADAKQAVDQKAEEDEAAKMEADAEKKKQQEADAQKAVDQKAEEDEAAKMEADAEKKKQQEADAQKAVDAEKKKQQEADAQKAVDAEKKNKQEADDRQVEEEKKKQEADDKQAEEEAVFILQTMQKHLYILIRKEHFSTIGATIKTATKFSNDFKETKINLPDKVINSLKNAVKRLNTYGDNNTIFGNTQTNMKEHAVGLYIIIDRIIKFIQDPTETFEPIVKVEDIKSRISSAIKERNEDQGNYAPTVKQEEIDELVKNTIIEYESYNYFDKTENKKKKVAWVGGRKTQKRNKKKRPNNCLFRKSVKNRK